MIDPLMEVRGVRHAVLIDAQGQVVTSVGLDAVQLRDELKMANAARAVIGSLQQNLRAREWQELVLDVSGGPVLFTPFGNQVLLVAFDDVVNLGRVRFAVRRLIGTA